MRTPPVYPVFPGAQRTRIRRVYLADENATFDLEPSEEILQVESDPEGVGWYVYVGGPV